MTGETSLYRRHRPQAFGEVVGQGHVVRTLSNAVERDRVHHAYLFVGSRGTGKTSLAKILARSLNCAEGPTLTPCGKCESCRAIAAGSSLDVIEMDAASNRSVDDIRDLRERVGYAPAAGRWKIYILDEAHMLTREAWNAFLKTLEEPPPNTVFILATTEPHKVMPTIVDRCQRFDFQRPSPEQIAEVVRRVAAAEKIEISDGAIAAIARAASGSFRDALGTLDQLVSYGGKQVNTDDVLAVLGVADAELILAAADAIAAGDGRGALEVSERLSASGRDVTQFARDLLAHLRQLIVIRTAGDLPDSFTVTAAEPERLRAQAEALPEQALGRAIDVLAKALADIREGDEPRMTVELALLRAARPQLDPSREALLERIERLEAALANGSPGGTPPAPARPSAGAGVRPEPEPSAEPAPNAADPASAKSSPAPSASEEASPAASDASSSAVEAAPSLEASADTSGDEEPPSAAEPKPPADGGEGPRATAVAEPIDLERIVSLWPAVIDQLRSSGSELLSHVLAAARPVSVNAEEAVVEVGFPPSAAFNKRKAEDAEARERMAEAVKAIAGTRLRPVYVLLDSEEVETPEEAKLSEEELIELVRAEFDAEEYIEIAEPDGEAEPKEAEG